MSNYILHLVLIVLFSSFFMQESRDTKLLGYKKNQLITPPQWPWKGVNFKCNIDTDIDKNDFSLISEKGINLVHILIEPPRQNINLSDEEIFKKLMTKTKEIIELCKKYNLTSIVSFHKFPFSSTKTFKQTSKYFWNNSDEIDIALSIFEMGVKELACYGKELSAYEFVSEPIIRDDIGIKTPRNLVEVQRRCINIIKKHDPGRYFCVSPGPGGHSKGYDDFEPFAYEKVIYNFHVFGPHAYTHQGVKKGSKLYKYPGYVNFKYWDTKKMNNFLKNTLVWKNKHNKLMIIGSFGAVHWAEGKNSYLNDIVSFATRNNYSYSYHCYNGYFGWGLKNRTHSKHLLKEKLNDFSFKINDSISRIYEDTWRIIGQNQ